MTLIDTHGRQINYLRLAVTDRCNLRCTYCMPAQGIQYLPKPHLLSFEEMLKLVDIVAGMGVDKVRITGGEPFLRKNIISFISELTTKVEKVSITTNGVLTLPYIKTLKEIGIHSVNLSLDSLNANRFASITRYNHFDAVWATFNGLLNAGIKTNINMVLMANQNEEDLLSMVELAKDRSVNVRIIEEMPFNGEGQRLDYFVDYIEIIRRIKEKHPSLTKIPSEQNSTTEDFQIDNFKGKIGIIPAFSRTFCGTCNRMRITPTGELLTCLYAAPSLNLRDLLRSNAKNSAVEAAIRSAFEKKAINGIEAEALRGEEISTSMTSIGG